MKIHKGADEAGLVAELLKNSSDDFQEDLLRLFNDSLQLHWKFSIMLEQNVFSDAGEEGTGSSTTI